MRERHYSMTFNSKVALVGFIFVCFMSNCLDAEDTKIEEALASKLIENWAALSHQIETADIELHRLIVSFKDNEPASREKMISLWEKHVVPNIGKDSKAIEEALKAIDNEFPGGQLNTVQVVMKKGFIRNDYLKDATGRELIYIKSEAGLLTRVLSPRDKYATWDKMKPPIRMIGAEEFRSIPFWVTKEMLAEKFRLAGREDGKITLTSGNGQRTKIVLGETTGLVHHRTSRFDSDILREENIYERTKNQFPLSVADAVLSVHYRKGGNKKSEVDFFEILIPSQVKLNKEIENSRFILGAPAGTSIGRRNADKTKTGVVRIEDAIDDIEAFAELLPDR